MAIDLGDAAVSSHPGKIKPSHWAVLRAFELGDFELDHVRQDLIELEALGLMEQRDSRWRITDSGRTLIALRRQI